MRTPRSFIPEDTSAVRYVLWEESGIDVCFHDGSIRGYEGVSLQRFYALIRSPDIGRYVAERIDGHYPEHEYDLSKANWSVEQLCVSLGMEPTMEPPQ